MTSGCSAIEEEEHIVLSFFVTKSMWFIHDNVQSTVKPRSLVELHIGMVLLL